MHPKRTRVTTPTSVTGGEDGAAGVVDDVHPLGPSLLGRRRIETWIARQGSQGIVDNVCVMQMLDSEEAARRLGVKVQTLYSYVSRGQISAHRDPDRRRIAFRADEIDDRARRLRRAGNSGGR